MMKYLAIDGGILVNKTIPPTDKLILAYVSNLNKADKFFYGTYAYMAETLGIRYSYFEVRIEKLLEVGLLKQTKEGMQLGFPLHIIAEKSWLLDKK
jgi:hypothetical protein